MFCVVAEFTMRVIVQLPASPLVTASLKPGSVGLSSAVESPLDAKVWPESALEIVLALTFKLDSQVATNAFDVAGTLIEIS